VARVRDFIRRWDSLFDKLEQGILVTLLLTMIGLAFTQLFIRVFLSSGIVWGDVALRHLVLWVGLLGATVATRESRHIHIDILPRLLTGKPKALLGILIDFFSALICSILTFGSFKFVSGEFLLKTTTFLQIPGWIVSMIFPIAFFVITIHFGLNGLTKLLTIGESVR
jgi:TRAP-type C4-dicarboxylate transport system permease small subunit